MSFTTPNSPTFGGGSSSSRHHHQHHHHHHQSSNHHTKRRWSEIEDKILKEAISRHGVNQWDGVARLIWTKSADECRARWAELVPVLHDNLAEEAAALVAADPPSSPASSYYSFDDDNEAGREEEERQQERRRRRERRREGARTEGAPPSPTQDGTETDIPGASRFRRNTEPTHTLSQRRAWRAPHPLMVPSTPPPVPQLVSTSTSTSTTASFSFSFDSPGILSPRSRRQSRSQGSSRNVSPTRITMPWDPWNK